MSKIAIFRTISHLQHPEVWEKSDPHLSNYNNSKSRFKTLEQIFAWSPGLKNSYYKSEDVKFGIGLYGARYYEQRYGPDWIKEYCNDQDCHPSILHVHDLNTHSGFIAHEKKRNIIEMRISLNKKLTEVDSIDFDTILCENALKFMKSKLNKTAFLIKQASGGYNIGEPLERLKGIKIFPLFFLLDENDFFDIIKSNSLNLSESTFS